MGRSRKLTAAIASSVVFGLLHFLAGPANVLATMIFGYLLYLTRRVSGVILLPIVVHFAWDISVSSSFATAQPAEGSDASVALALASVILLVIVVAAHRLVAEGRPLAPG